MMVLLLLGYIFPNCAYIGLAYCKGSITTLPRKVFESREYLMHPTARIRFQLPQDIGERTVRSKLCQQMKMIRGPI